MISEDEYLKKQEHDSLVEQSGVRWVYNYFMIAEELKNEDYINHSEEPNLLYHLGICFALKDINPGDELTVNYQYFLSEKDKQGFKDSKT